MKVKKFICLKNCSELYYEKSKRCKTNNIENFNCPCGNEPWWIQNKEEIIKENCCHVIGFGICGELDILYKDTDISWYIKNNSIEFFKYCPYCGIKLRKERKKYNLGGE